METSFDPVRIHNDVEITLKNDNFFETFVVCDPKRYRKSRRRRRKDRSNLLLPMADESFSRSARVRVLEMERVLC